MKITKRQLQRLIRERLDARSQNMKDSPIISQFLSKVAMESKKSAVLPGVFYNNFMVYIAQLQDAGMPDEIIVIALEPVLDRAISDMASSGNQGQIIDVPNSYDPVSGNIIGVK